MRRRLIADLITSLQPDVVALQETRHDFRFEGGKGQGEQLAALTGYHPTIAVAQVYIPLARVDEGLTILTRGTPQRTMLQPLTQFPQERMDENHRICLGVTIEAEGREIDIYDTHFSLSPVARRHNAREVARFAAAESGSRPMLVMGDLNAEPDEAAIRFLVGEEEINGQRADFVDCWMLANPAQPGYTYASFDPVKRIDYVLGRNLPGGVAAAEVVGRDAVDGIYPSDHLGIAVDVPL